MVRAPTFDINGMKKGAWSREEDDILRAYVDRFGHNNWRRLPQLAGLARCGKSCRLRWMNYLKPGLKRGKFTKIEEDLIVKLHNQLGNKWSAIAAKLNGRSDNEIKNHWHAHLKKRGDNDDSGHRRDQEESFEDVDLYKFERDSSEDVVSQPYEMFSPQFNVDEFCDFGVLIEEMQSDNSSNYSEIGSSFSSSSSSSADLQGGFWSEPFEEDILDLELW